MISFSISDSIQPRLVPDVLRHLKISLTLRRKLKKADGAILVNGCPASWGTLIYPGDILSIKWPADCSIEPHAMPLSISYEDSMLLVVDKPAGLLVHPASGSQEITLANGIIHYLQKENPHPGFHPAHRLDRNTSGLLLIAKNPHCQHLLSLSGDKSLRRGYLAVVSGVPSPPQGTIDAPIGRLTGSIIQRCVLETGQRAITHYQIVETFGQYSLVQLRLETGRTHQLRVHLSHVGHPILGDDLYGGSRTDIQRQALHAASLEFTHPITGENLALTSPLPTDITMLIRRISTKS
ncbi:MAG: pseudouridine synthase, RluA family [Firmicutes bacterium]|nr:pseudouridine synthase, RluA family [Bacillota bacterium]